MFWKFNLLTSSHIDTLLDKEDVTLYELMDEDDILQECKAQNRKLTTFLVMPAHMEELVKLITEEPTEEMEDKVKYKFPNTACELLTSDVSQINDALAGSDDLVQKLYSFLDSDSVLNPLLASFFSKVMGLLITRKSEMILEFLKSREDFVGTLLKHIGTSAIMDLLLRLLTCIESPEIRRAMIEWLNEERIVKRLVSCITPAYDEDIHCNAAQSLCDIIRLGREQVIQLQDRAEPDPLLTTVEMEETVAELLDNMLSGDKNESVIVNGLSVIQTLLEFKKQGPEDSVEQMTVMDAERMFTGVNNVLTAICPRLKDFHNILLDPPPQRFSIMPSSAGNLNPPLGNTRLQTGRLIASLLLTNTHSINVELTNLTTISVLLDLYFRYIWNNFLHTHVTQCIYTILTNPPIEVEGKKECPLLNQLFTEVKVVEKILNEWEANDQEQSKEGGKRKGFMGHLTRMANDIVNAQEKGENVDLLMSLVNEIDDDVKQRWEAYLTGTLSETNKKNTVELVRGHALASSSEDDDADFSNIPFPQDTAMQQAFSDYQLQQMTSNFIDQFGFNEEEFGEQEEKTDSPFMDRISSIDFGVGVNEDTRANASMFEQSCKERLQQFEDSDEDIWEEKEIQFSPGTPTKRFERLPVARGSHDSDDSTDSEEELDSPKTIPQQSAADEKMDVDSNEAWTATLDQQGSGADVGPIAMDTSPWDNSTKPKEEAEKWADFTNNVPADETNTDNWADFSNFSDIKSEEPEPRSSSPVDMDTTEPTASSRTNAYLADNKESDLKLESIDTASSVEVSDRDTESQVIEKSGTTQSEQQQQEEETSSKSQQVVNTTDNQSPSRTNPVTENQSEDSQSETSSQPHASPEGQSPIISPEPKPEEQSPCSPASNTDNCDLNPATNVDCDSTTQSDDKPASPETQAKGDGCSTGETDEDSDDLNANFNFLSKVGLIKPAGSTPPPSNCKPGPGSVGESPVQIQGNGPTSNDTDLQADMEKLRAQAKDALESFDTAITTGASSQNGPV